MIVLDLETTGTEPSKHSIVSLCALEFENPDNRFYGECRIWDGAHVEEVALSINGLTREQITDASRQTEAQLAAAYLEWSKSCKESTIVGQSPAFDRDFVRAAAARAGLDQRIASRTIDMHSIACAHMLAAGRELPVVNSHSGVDSDFIMEYVGIPAEPKPHAGMNGALWEAEAVHRLIYGRGLLPQFAEYPVPFGK